VPPVLNAIAGFIEAHGEEISSFLDGIWKVISGIIQAALALIQGILKTALALIRGDWQGAWQAIQDMSADFVRAIARVIEGAAQMFYAAARSLIDAILSAWRSFADWAGLGGSVIDGIISGILGGIGRLPSMVVSSGLSVGRNGVSLPGMGSPAKLFMPVGESMPEGMAVGVERATPTLLDAMTRAAVAPIASVQQLLAGGGASSVTYNQQRSYTMPIYTNQSPAVLVQSAAILEAMNA